ncbi:MAG: NAD(P)H-dependent oxidoreductase [Acidobacteriia bacterium]|nr:NAD(P)H-dependent oxidoreductase [Terriglobia bacterium]
MKVFMVLAHPEPRSFCGAMTDRAVRVLRAEGHEVRVSDLYAMRFDPVSDRRNFTSVKDGAYFQQQVEEQAAVEASGFAPDIAAEMEKLRWCDALIFVFPLWWFGLPAILKGWTDRVLAMGFAYGGGRWYDHGAFAGKRGMLALSTGGAASLFEADGINGDMERILFPVQHGILYFVGFSVLPPFVAYAPTHGDDASRDAQMAEWDGRLRTLATAEPIPFPPLEAYDENLRLRT